MTEFSRFIPIRLLRAVLSTLCSRMQNGPLRPGWSFEFETAVAFLRATAHLASGRSPMEQRSLWNALVPLRNAVKNQVKESETEVAGLRARWVVPRMSPATDVVVYLHGGAFIWGTYSAYAELVARIALATGARVLWLDYPLAPEQPFPAAIEAIHRVFLTLRSAPFPLGRLFLAGDSAGGNLVIAVAMTRTVESASIAGCILLSPWVDLARQGGSLTANERVDWGIASDFSNWAAVYAPAVALTAPMLSVVNADLQTLPPVLVLYGECEMLRDQIESWVDRARAQGVVVSSRMFASMVHNWVIMSALTPEAGHAIDEIGRFVRESVPGD